MIDFNIPLGGISRASAELDQTASKIARASFPQTDSVDLSAEIVGMLRERNAFETNVKVVEVENDTSKSLLNLLA